MDPNGKGAELAEKVESLTAQMQVLVEYVEDQRRRQREWDELKADLTPVAMEAYKVTVEQLAELEPHVRLEDLVYLVKRLARNTRNIEMLLDQVESLSDLVHDATPIVNDAVLTAVEQMDTMERRGYFRLVKEGQGVLDNIVDNFGPDDVRLLGDNIVTILTTVKQMTQPEIMGMMQNLAGSMRELEAVPEETSTSFWSLLMQMRDPEVRRGLARGLGMLKAMGADAVPANGTGTYVRDNF